MLKYIALRLLTFFLVLIGTSFVAFMILYFFSPEGAPASIAVWFGHTDGSPSGIYAWNAVRGLNDHILIQYIRYIAGVFRGNLGVSFTHFVPLTPIIMQHFSHTVLLGLFSIAISLILAFLTSTVSYKKKSFWIGGATKAIALIGISMPAFVLGMLLIFLFPEAIGALITIRQPGLGRYASFTNNYNLLLPSVSLGIVMFFVILYSINSTFPSIIRQNYIRTAYSKGLSEDRVFKKHILYNIFACTLPALRANLGTFFANIIFIEFLFSRPGIGWILHRTAWSRDYPMILGCLIMFILFYWLINVILDIAQAFIDPRKREPFSPLYMSQY